jgi:hypothetical protein
MSRIMLKYGPITPDQTLECRGQPRHVGMLPDGGIYVWCSLLAGVTEETVPVRLYPTGYLDWVGDYIGTVITPEGLVWHAIRIYEED